jgi:hypothetical protein
MAESEVISPSFPKGMGKIRINLSEVVTRCFRVEIGNQHLRTIKNEVNVQQQITAFGGKSEAVRSSETSFNF